MQVWERIQPDNQPAGGKYRPSLESNFKCLFVATELNKIGGQSFGGHGPTTIYALASAGGESSILPSLMSKILSCEILLMGVYLCLF